MYHFILVTVLVYFMFCVYVVPVYMCIAVLPFWSNNGIIRQPFNFHSSAIGPRCNHSTTYVTAKKGRPTNCEVLHCGLNKQAVLEAATICPRPLQVELLPSDLVSCVRVTCDVGYLCANFSLPRPLCSRLRPDVRDRQTSDVHHRLMPPTLGAGHNK